MAAWLSYPAFLRTQDYHSKGHIDLEAFKQVLGKVRPTDCAYYVCGPSPMMVDFRAMLTWLNVGGEHINFECFGPAIADIDAAAAPPASY